jgi:hypothetical protein
MGNHPSDEPLFPENALRVVMEAVARSEEMLK